MAARSLPDRPDIPFLVCVALDLKIYARSVEQATDRITALCARLQEDIAIIEWTILEIEKMKEEKPI